MLALLLAHVRPCGTLPVYHFAPEPAIARLLQDKFGKQYRPADLIPEEYPWTTIPVTKVDLCYPERSFGPKSVQGFIHSHVLEHIHAPLHSVIREMNRAIAPGGFHIIQVPIADGHFREDMDPELSADDRLRLFDQSDHVRMFGSKDFQRQLLDLFDGMKQIDISRLISRELIKKAAISEKVINRYTGHSVFYFKKPRIFQRIKASLMSG